MDGGPGNDHMYGNDLPEILIGDDGYVFYRNGELDYGTVDPIVDSLYSIYYNETGGDDVIFGYGGVDNIFGMKGDDFLDGGADNDFVVGG